MFLLESKMVTTELVSDDQCYNRKTGGLGGWSHWNNGSCDHKTAARSGAFKTLQTRRKTELRIKSSQQTIKIAASKANTEEAKQKRKETHRNKKHQQGEKNSQFGTCWMYKDSENFKIPKRDVEQFEKDGYIKGRLLKK